MSVGGPSWELGFSHRNFLGVSILACPSHRCQMSMLTLQKRNPRHRDFDCRLSSKMNRFPRVLERVKLVFHFVDIASAPFMTIFHFRSAHSLVQETRFIFRSPGFPVIWLVAPLVSEVMVNDFHVVRAWIPWFYWRVLPLMEIAYPHSLFSVPGQKFRSFTSLEQLSMRALGRRGSGFPDSFHKLWGVCVVTSLE